MRPETAMALAFVSGLLGFVSLVVAAYFYGRASAFREVRMMMMSNPNPSKGAEA